MTLRHKSLFCVDLSLSLRGSCLCSRQDSRRLKVLHCWPLPATKAHNFTTVGEFLLFYTQQKISFLYMISHGFKSNENDKSWSDCLVESVSTFAHMTFIHGCMNAYKISLNVCMCVCGSVCGCVWVYICVWVNVYLPVSMNCLNIPYLCNFVARKVSSVYRRTRCGSL